MTLFMSMKHTMRLRRHGQDRRHRAAAEGQDECEQEEPVKLGSSSFKVKKGTKGKITLTKKGVKRLKRLKKIKAKVKITVKRGAVVRTKTVTVTLKAPKPRNKKS